MKFPRLARTFTQGQIVTLKAAPDGDSLAEAARQKLLADLRAGAHVQPLTMTAIVFRQGKERGQSPNLNFVRLAARNLGRIAASFAGAPFLRDHADGNLLARGGTIRASRLVTRDHGPAFEQDIELVKPWAIEAALDGTLDRFSVGWNGVGEVICTACDAPMFSRDCQHLPGDTVKVKGKGEVLVEAEFQDAMGLETSGVSVPAVQGTGIEDIRAALAFARGLEPLRLNTKEQDMNILPKLAAAFGLAADSNEEQCLAGAEGMARKLAEAGQKLAAADQMLAAEREAHGGTKAALLELRGKAERQAADELQRATEALIEGAVAAGKIRPKLAEGKRVETEVEKAIRMMAQTSLAAAKEWVDGLPAVLPIGGKLQSGSNAPTEKQDSLVISEVQRRLNQQLGTTDEEFKKFQPRRENAGEGR